MKNEKLLQAMGQVKEEFIEEAAPGKNDVQAEQTKRVKSSYSRIKWAVLAACAVLAIGIGASHMSGIWKDDTRSFWPEGERVAQEGILTAIAALDDTTDYVVFDKGFPDWGLTLSVKDVMNTGLTLVCTQQGGNPDGEIDCGEDYQLLVLDGETWRDVPTVIESYGFNCLAHWIPKGQDTEFPISWEWLYGKLPAGTYRLVKGFMNFRGTGDYDTAGYWVEFEITE